MSAAPKYKVFRASEGYVASTKFLDDAAAIIAVRASDGDTIRVGHAKSDIVWEEGICGEAGASFDEVIDHVTAFGKHRAHAGVCMEHRDWMDERARQHHTPDEHVGAGPCRCFQYRS